MKNLKETWFPLALVFLFLCALSSCVEKDKKPQEEEEKPKEVKAPKNIISLEQADTIYQNYSKHRISIIQNYETTERAPSESFEPARFVDFDYDTIKKYIAYIDQEAAKAGVKKVTKLRLYFANYPNKEDFPDGKKVVHPRQNSVFMIPTLERDGGNYSFYIGDDGKPKLVIDWKDDIMQKGMGTLIKDSKRNQASMIPNFSLNSSLQVNKSLALNRGHGGPPPRTEF